MAAGTYGVLRPITIAPHQSMAMSISGLPSRPAWRARVQAIIGVLVVAVMLAGIAFAMLGRRSGSADRSAQASGAARRQKLLDELVELERTGGSPKRREQLLDELERLWS